MEGSTQAPRRSMSADLFSIRRLLYNLVDRIFIFLHHLLDSYWRTSCIFLYHPMAMDNGIYPSQIVQPSSSAYLSRKEISCILYLLEASVYMAGTSCQSNVFFDGLEKEKKNAIGKVIAIFTLLRIAQFSCTGGHEACRLLFQI